MRVLTIILNAAWSAGPKALPMTWFSVNMSLSRPKRFSIAARLSVRLTSRSVGLGKKTSSRSDTTSMLESEVPAYGMSIIITPCPHNMTSRLTGREKKCSDTSNAMKATLVRLSSFGIRSRFSRMVRVAVATMPD